MLFDNWVFVLRSFYDASYDGMGESEGIMGFLLRRLRSDDISGI